AERKECERFQAATMDIPEDMDERSLFPDRMIYPSLAVVGIKAFKIVGLCNKKRKLIGYFESWDKANRIRFVPSEWKDSKLDWARHSSPNFSQQVDRNNQEAQRQVHQRQHNTKS